MNSNTMNNMDTPIDNNNTVNEALPTLYDEEMANILQNDNIFDNTDSILGNVPQDMSTTSTTSNAAAPQPTNTVDSLNNIHRGTNTAEDDDLHTIDITNPNTENIDNNNSNATSTTNVPYPLHKKYSNQFSNANNTPTDNSSSGTVEDIINPSFIKPSNPSTTKERSLMLARDTKANFRRLMRRGSPLGLFNSDNLTQNDINNILNNNIGGNNTNSAVDNSKIAGADIDINSNNNSINNNYSNLPNRNSTPLYSSDIVRNSIPQPRDFTNINTNIPANNNQANPQSNTNVQRKHNAHKTRPAFVNKLWSMINDIDNKDLIQWAEDGKSFIVTNRENFVHNILPRYFKHSNFASFVRQLNMYGWHKVQDVKSGSIQGSSDDRWQFANENFQRDREDLLINIVRQRGGNHNQPGNGSNNSNNSNSNNVNSNTHFPNYNINQKLLQNIEDVQDLNDPMRLGGNSNNNTNYKLPGNLNPRASLHITNGPESIQIQNNIATVLNELEQIKYNQIAISKDLLRINKDNDLLWKENMMARERYMSQQQILEKIFRFMAAMMPHMDQKMIMDGIVDNSNDKMNYNSSNTTHHNINTNSNNIKRTSLSNRDRNNSMFNGMIDYDNVSPQVISPSENSEKRHGVYLETLEDVDNSPPGSMSMNSNRVNGNGNSNNIYHNNNNNNGNNRKRNSSVNDRFLIKNKSPSSEDLDRITSTNTTSTNSDNNFNNGKISELPFNESDENISPIIQEVHSNKTSPQLNNNNNDDNNTNTIPNIANHDEFFNNLQENISDDNKTNPIRDLQDNINEQDSRIHHLENMITQLTPKLMSPMSNTTHLQHSNNNTNNNFNFQDYFSQPGPQLVETPSQQQQDNDSNSLPEALRQIPLPPAVIQSGLTPYMTDDPSLLTSDLNNAPTYDISTPQIEELSELNELNQLKQLNGKRKGPTAGHDDNDNLNDSYKRQRK
ncbi:heat shock transcription factor [Monosporozyma servazzii]